MSRESAGPCPTCGGPLSAGGSCPRCLFDLGLEPPTETDVPAKPALVAGRDRIGRYRLRDVLGEGGMGIVYLAEQEQPIRRQVALKLIKPGMDSGQVMARFESERQALAMMSHPNVARVFDAGVSDDGRPYFVMEYVPGIPITDYCDQQRLSIRERLDLFVQACEALQHAHQKGLIHRDIKPSNVLVCRENEKATVKVIDFGVAKATHQKLTERTLYTELGVAIGTPGYMSPEQAGSTALDVDTRADIYSLGVVLYELLVGVLPFDPKALRMAADAEMLRIIREVEPPRPSTRIHSLGETGHDLARRRRTDLPTLTRMLSGELEWIALKALEKDPGRRYSTASEFAADVRRYLGGEAILARPATVWYRSRKFVRRHRLPVAAAAAVLVALMAGLVTSLTLYVRAVEARDQARREADKAQAINAFLQDTLGSAVPGKQGRQVLVMDVIKSAAEKVDSSFADQPDVRVALHQTIGGVFGLLGMMDDVDREITKVLEYQRSTLGEDSRDTIRTQIWRGRIRFEAHRYDPSIQDFTAALEHGRRALGPEATETIEAMHLLGNVYNLSGRQREAEPLIVEALRLHEKVDGPDHFLTGTNRMSLAGLYYYSQRLDQSEAEWRRAIAILVPRVGETDWLTLRAKEELADIYTREGRLDLAEPLAREVFAISAKDLGEKHTQTNVAAGVMANVHAERGDFAEAERIDREQVALRRQGDLGARTLSFSLSRLTYVLARQGKDEAKETGAEAVAVATRDYGDPHRHVADALRSQAFALYRARHAEFDASEAAYRKSIAMFRGLFGNLHPYVAGAIKDFGVMEHTRGRHDVAIGLFAEALRIWGDLGMETPWPESELKARMGGCLVETGRYAEAERPLGEGYEFLRARRGEADRLTVEARDHRIALLEATRRPAEAAALRKEILSAR